MWKAQAAWQQPKRQIVNKLGGCRTAVSKLNIRVLTLKRFATKIAVKLPPRVIFSLVNCQNLVNKNELPGGNTLT